jgi:hypothetical protein
MPTGNTTTGSLADSQQTIIDSARIVREFEGTYMRTTETHTLPEGTGLNWEEISLAALTAQTVTETTDLNNPQQLSDSLMTATPTMTGLNYVITDRVYRRLPKMVTGKFGQLGQNAIQRKRDQNYLDIFATATTTLCGTGTTLQSGHLAAGRVRIASNTTERSTGPINCVLHGYGIKDIRDELVSGVGTYAIPSGMTEDVFKRGFMGTTVDGVNVWEDGNITINATPDARGGIHAKEAVLFVQGFAPKTETLRRPSIGGGADEMFHYDENVFAERSAGNWLYGLLHDGTVPSN